MKTYYMHTLDGKPAYFCETSGYICFAPQYGSAAILAKSLAQIRREQRKDAAIGSGDFIHGYIRVSVPE